MAAEIVKVYKEHFPAVQLIGKCYFEEGRKDGGFSHKWEQWFEDGLFEKLENEIFALENGGDYLGAMRYAGGQFKYRIGIFFPKGAAVPDGFEGVDIAAFDGVTCFVSGDESKGEVYGMAVCDMVEAKIKEQGFSVKEGGWWIERYNKARFTTPDSAGNVILDYCVSVI